MIPLFPKFKKLELADKKEIESFTKQFPPYSDYNFTSMYCYNTEDKMRVSWLNGNLVVRFQDYLTNELFYSFLGTKKVAETAAALLDFSKKKSLPPMLKLIPEVTVQADGKLSELFVVKEDRDNFDYIYDVLKLACLRGKKYYTKLKQVKRFYKLHPDCRVGNLDINNPMIKKAIINVFVTWEKTKGKMRKETKHELIALKRLLKQTHIFNLFSIGVYLKKKLIGFSIAEVIYKKYALHHFIKANVLYKEIFTIIYKALAENISIQKIDFLNNEQDLGINGLRQAKLLWKPLNFFKKYSLLCKK